MALLLGSISNSARSSPQAGGTRDDSSRGTPSLMDRHRKTIQTNMITIKNMMVDIAHASHHLDYLKKGGGYQHSSSGPKSGTEDDVGGRRQSHS